MSSATPYIRTIRFLRPTRPRSLVMGLVCGLTLSACARPDIVGPGRGDFIAPSEAGIGLELSGGLFRVDGVVISNRINLSTERFVYLFVFLKSKGMYIVSAEEMEGGVVSGRFSGTELRFVVNDTRIELEGDGRHLLADNKDRSAWVEYIPDYEDLLGPDAQPGNAVLGLAARKNLIPGYVAYDQ